MKAEDAPMTRARFAEYFRYVAGLMGLGHWTFEADDEPPREGGYAEIHCWYGQFGATVKASDALLAEPEETVRKAAAHELVHCHLSHADRLAGECMRGVEHDSWTLANEYAVDALSKVVARSLPLPSEVFGREPAGNRAKTAQNPRKPGKTARKGPKTG